MFVVLLESGSRTLRVSTGAKLVAIASYAASHEQGNLRRGIFVDQWVGTERSQDLAVDLHSVSVLLCMQEHVAGNGKGLQKCFLLDTMYNRLLLIFMTGQ